MIKVFQSHSGIQYEGTPGEVGYFEKGIWEGFSVCWTVLDITFGQTHNRRWRDVHGLSGTETGEIFGLAE